MEGGLGGSEEDEDAEEERTGLLSSPPGIMGAESMKSIELSHVDLSSGGHNDDPTTSAHQGANQQQRDHQEVRSRRRPENSTPFASISSISGGGGGGAPVHAGMERSINGTTAASLPTATLASTGLAPASQALLGLCIHAAADGLAVGAACLSEDLGLTAAISVAIIIHKFPVAFGVAAYLKEAGWAGWRLQRGERTRLPCR